MSLGQRASHWSGLLGVVLLLVGSYIGLFVAPPERHMGDVQRILYVHVPTAWIHMVCYFIAFLCAAAALWSGRRKWDYTMTGAVETGVVLNLLLLIQGTIFARPTWGVWWAWGDMRLMASFLTFLIYAGVLALRSFVEEPDKRFRWMAVTNIVAFMAVIFNRYAPEIFPALHQIRSSPETIDASMKLPMRINAFALLFLAIWFIAQRALLERRRGELEEVEAPQRVMAQEEI